MHAPDVDNAQQLARDVPQSYAINHEGQYAEHDLHSKWVSVSEFKDYRLLFDAHVVQHQELLRRMEINKLDSE